MLPPTFNSLASKFLDHARYGQNLSKATLTNYANRLRRFEYWTERGEVQPPRDGRTKDSRIPVAATVLLDQFEAIRLEQYRDELGRAGLRPRTIRAMFQPLRSLGDYLVSKKVLPANPCHGIVMPRKDAPTRQIVTTSQSKAILDACDHFYPERDKLRAKALVAVLVYTGLRRGELFNLRVPDVFPAEVDPFLVVTRGKGDKRRLIFLFPECVRAIEEWLAERQKMNCRHDFLFAYDRSRAVSHLALATILDRAAAIAGLPEGTKIRPHGTRRNVATRLLEAGSDLVVIQEWLGHSSLTTTAQYLFGEEHRMRRAAKNIGLKPSEPAVVSAIPAGAAIIDVPETRPEGKRRPTIGSFTRLRRTATGIR